MMKKVILSSLFSATLLVGGVSYTAFAEESLPSNPTTPPSGEVTPPSDEVPTTPSNPVLPPDTGDSGTGEDTGSTTPPDTGNSGTGGDTGTTTPPNTGNDSTGGTTGETTPPTNGNSGEQPLTPPTTNVGINSDGTINSSGSGTQMTPVQTNAMNELTHIPTASTPVETDTGEKIVSVVNGVAYKQANDGTLTPITAEVKQLPSGNIAVKGSDGQLKVLPKTGTKQTVMMTVLGSLLTLGSGFAWWKKRV